MGIDAVHPQYAAMIDKWQRCRDAYDGEDEVKARGAQYLPMLGGQTQAEYAAYVTRALYYEAVSRTVDGFVGSITRKPSEITLPSGIATIMDNATPDGLTLPEFVKMLCAESMMMGRGGTLVEMDPATGKPYLALYTAENIRNWSTTDIVLFETVYERDPDDQFKTVAIPQYRHLELIKGVYTVTLWRKATTKAGVQPLQEWEVYQVITPVNRGRALAEIPWFWLTPLGRTNSIVKPPLLGLVNVALSHYRTSADLEHGRHFSALPTLYVAGISDANATITVGSQAAILLMDPQAKVGYAEFSGQGLGSLELALEAKEKMMAVLGAAVFADAKKGVEAAETAQIRNSGETSLMMGAVLAAEQCLTAALAAAASWAGVSGKAEIKLNRDFVDIRMEPTTLQGLVAAYQAGAVSLTSFLYNLQQAEMLPPDTDIDAEAASLEAKADQKSKDALAGQVTLKQTAPPAKPKA